MQTLVRSATAVRRAPASRFALLRQYHRGGAACTAAIVDRLCPTSSSGTLIRRRSGRTERSRGFTSFSSYPSSTTTGGTPCLTTALDRRRMLANNPKKNPYDRRRFLSSENDDDDAASVLNEPRESMPFDVLIVGGGPAGLAASIRIRQLCQEKGVDLSVCVVEKGSEIGSHILSGNVFDPRALTELLPDVDDWPTELYDAQSSKATPVSHDEFLVLSESSSYSIPTILLPSQLHNDGNYIISLGQLCRWLGTKAEELGVEVYPGFAAAEVVYTEDGGAVRGIATRDVGIGKDGKPKATFERGVELHGRQTLFAEGARGSCSESLISRFDLRKDRANQTYGLGVKEVWEVPPETFQPGLVQHTLGYPLQSSVFDKTFGGTFLYHQEPNLVLAGLVVGLDYPNPYLNPYQEFQRWKTHPDIKKHFEGGTCISYGARVLNEGGLHSLPKLTFPGGALLGCGAGFLNSVKIKGTHTAIKSGIVAAESVFEALAGGDGAAEAVASTGEIDSSEAVQEVATYEERMNQSWVHEELYQVRNCHEAFARWGLVPGLMYAGLAAHVTKGREPWTLSHEGRDCEKTKPADRFQPIEYPAPDGMITFDLLTNLQRSGTYHEDDQPAHLRIKEDLMKVPESVSMQIYAAPEQRFCPAAVYEYVDDEDSSDGEKKLVINAQNCVHCKCCSIKMPHEYINWTVPEGGGGPQYQLM